MTGLYQSWGSAAQNAAQSAQIAQQTNKNGGLNWWSGENIGGYADAFASILDSIKGTSGPDTVVYQTSPLSPTGNDSGTKTVWIVLGVVGFVVFIGALYWIKKR